jgi:hypothetical protein
MAGPKRSKIYYLIDTSAVIHHYKEDPQLTPRIEHIVEQQGLGRAVLFIPNFCIAEVFNTFAKLHFRERSLIGEEYQKCCEQFRHDIHNAKLFYHYELQRYHILNVDYIVPFEHQLLTNQDEYLSTFDIIILAMGIELVRIVGEKDFFIITCDKRIHSIGKSLRGLPNEYRQRYSVPEYVKYPKTIYLHKTPLSNLPR